MDACSFVDEVRLRDADWVLGQAVFVQETKVIESSLQA